MPPVTLWWLGYPDQALQRSHEALTLAQELAYPYSLAFALFLAALVHQFRREGQLTQERAEAASALAAEQGFAILVAGGMFLRGWALTERSPAPGAGQGQVEEGLAQMHQGLAAFRATGAETFRPYFLALLAEASGKAGQARGRAHPAGRGAGSGTREQGSAAGKPSCIGSRASYCWRVLRGMHAEAEACFRQALDMARQQQAKSLELRAAMSLARLWQGQGKHAEARQLLAPIYNWFTEGFDTADLREAKGLLEALP